MADLLEAGIEALRQHMHVVAQCFRRAEERRIGHHHGSREIIRKRNPIKPPRRVVERAGAVDDGVDRAAAFGKADLERKLEGAAGAVDQFGDQKLPAMPVEAPQRLAHHVDRHDAGDDRMFFTQPRGKRCEQLFRGTAELVAQAFRRRLQFGKIVAVGLDQVAHPLDRIGLEARALVAVGHLRRHHGLAAARLGIGGVEPLQRMRHAGAELGEVAQLLLRQVDLAEQRIGENLVQFGEEAVLVGGREIAQVEVIGFRQAQQQLRRHRALIALDQVDVAWRDLQPLGHLGLRQPQLLPDAPEAGPDEQLFCGCSVGHGSLLDLNLLGFSPPYGRSPGGTRAPHLESTGPRSNNVSLTYPNL